ncbi:MAG TPA: hypothetical protein ENH82_02235 [bacterium]|nr:hypothetical protein [bacterium]
MIDLTKPFIIAEAGTNHADANSSNRLKKALHYVEVAVEAGADAVKFQMFAEPLTDMFCWIDGDEDRAARWLNSVLTFDQWWEVKKKADFLGIVLLASVFQDKTITWIEELGLEATKVASRAANTFPYGRGPKPYFVSNGMSSVPDDVIEFQCEANYPSTQWWGKITPGFSDHSGSPARAVHALENGCKLIEVHFYDDPDDAGPDLLACLTIDQLSFVCRSKNV